MEKSLENYAFIDGQNLYMGTCSSEVPWKIDFFRFRTYLREKYKVEKAYYYIGYIVDKNDSLYKKIQEAGFILVFRKHNLIMAGKKKGNVDSDIIFDVMKKIYRQENFKKIILISGDGDFRKLTDFLTKENRLEKILFPNKKYSSSLYKALNPRCYDNLDAKDVRKKIGKKIETKNKKGHLRYCSVWIPFIFTYLYSIFSKCFCQNFSSLRGFNRPRLNPLFSKALQARLINFINKTTKLITKHLDSINMSFPRRREFGEVGKPEKHLQEKANKKHLGSIYKIEPTQKSRSFLSKCVSKLELGNKKKHKKKFILSRSLAAKKGETVLEVLISFFILTTTLSTSVYLLGSIKKASDEAKNRTVAINLAREGIEGVRNLRDSNWMNFSSSKRKKWNCANSESCDNKIQHGYCYAIDISSDDNRWELKYPEATSDLDDKTRKLCLDGNAYKHNYNGTSCPSGANPFFKREVCFEYLKNDGSAITESEKNDFIDGTTNLPKENTGVIHDNILQVTLTLDWPHLAGPKENPVKIVTELTDFLGRENKDD